MKRGLLLAITITSCSTCYDTPKLENYDCNGTEIMIGDSVSDKHGAGKVIFWPGDSTAAVQFAPDVIMEINGKYLTVKKKSK